MTPKRDWALWLVGRGFPVFRCQVGSKKPLDNHTTDATLDPAEVRRRWSEPVTGMALDYNIGIPTTGMVVVDVDNGDGKPGYESLAAFGLTTQITYCIKTPSGGAHLYFKTEADIAGSVESIAPGIDIRAYHNYVVGPGSEIDGVPYQIVCDAPLAAAPPQILQRCRAAGAERPRIASSIELDTDSAITTAKLYLENDAPAAIEGQGGDLTTFQVACEVRDRGVSEDMCLELMLAWNDSKAHPPWSYDDLVSKIENAYRYAQRGEGEKNPARNFGAVNLDGLDDLLPKEDAKIPDQNGQDSQETFPDGNLMPLWKLTAPRPWLFKGMLERGEITALIGTGGVGKSQFELSVAIALALGESVFGFENVAGGPQRTMIYNAEDSEEEMAMRVYATCTSWGVEVEAVRPYLSLRSRRSFENKVSFATGGPSPSMSEKDTYWKEEFIRQATGRALIILDPLTKLSTIGGSDNTGMSFLMDVLNEIAYASNCAMLVAQHTSKPGIASSNGYAGNVDASRGASTITDSVRAAFTLMGPTDEDAALYGIQHERNMYLRLDAAKMNHAAKSDKPTWMKRDVVQGINGELIATLKHHDMSSMLVDEMRKMGDTIAAGIGAGSSLSIAQAAKYYRDIIPLASKLTVKTIEMKIENSLPIPTSSGAHIAKRPDGRLDVVRD